MPKVREVGVYYKVQGRWQVWNGLRFNCVRHGTRNDRCIPCSSEWCAVHTPMLTNCSACRTPPNQKWLQCNLHKLMLRSCSDCNTVKQPCKARKAPPPQKNTLCRVHLWIRACRQCRKGFKQCREHRLIINQCSMCRP